MELFLRSVIVLVILFVVSAALIGAADAFKYKDFSGSVVGAAGTIFAGWLAWQAVYRQSRVQSAQAAIGLLAIVEQDARQVAEEKQILGALWSVTAGLLEQLEDFLAKGRRVSDLQQAISGFQSIHSGNLNILTFRVTLDPEIRLACGVLSGRLSLIQAQIQLFLENVKTVGEYSDEVVEGAKRAYGGQLKELVAEARRLLDAANAEEDTLRDRARRLRLAANDLPD